MITALVAGQDVPIYSYKIPFRPALSYINWLELINSTSVSETSHSQWPMGQNYLIMIGQDKELDFTASETLFTYGPKAIMADLARCLFSNEIIYMNRDHLHDYLSWVDQTLWHSLIDVL